VQFLLEEDDMTKRIDEAAAKEQVLGWLALFCERLLPGTVRRIIMWKRLPPHALPEMCDEARQELALDSLQHFWQLAVQPRPVVHARWMRLAERVIYRHWVAKRATASLPADAIAPPEAALVGDELDLPELEALRNGRTNVVGSAARRGVTPRRLRKQLDDIAERLGRGTDHHAFWCTRLAEALTGLAADLLRDRGCVQLLPRQRQPPDPVARLRRIRRMAVRFHIRPATLRERSILRRWLGSPRLDGDAPRRLLEHAVQLAPFDRAAWLWLFEACVADGDLRAAARALRKCRQLAAPTVASSTLARARLLEARGHHERAIAGVVRAARRWPRDKVLRELRTAVAATSRDLATTTETAWSKA
jgi:hypothetical protein